MMGHCNGIKFNGVVRASNGLLVHLGGKPGLQRLSRRQETQSFPDKWFGGCPVLVDGVPPGRQAGLSELPSDPSFYLTADIGYPMMLATARTNGRRL
jgi:hypothetical protein